MQKSTKDRVINFVSIGVAATSLLTGLWCIPLGPVLFFSMRAVTRKLLYSDLDRLEARLMGLSQDDRQSAARELAGHKDSRAKELLFAAMHKEVPEVQVVAAQSLLALGDDRASAFLMKAMLSDNSTLRKKAAQLLAESGWAPQTSAERVQQWIAFGDFTQPVGEGIAAVAPLVGAFDVTRTDATARTDIVWALAKIGTQEVVDPLLQRMEHDESKAVRYSTDKALKGLVHTMTDFQRSRYMTLSTRLAQEGRRAQAEKRTAQVIVERTTEKGEDRTGARHPAQSPQSGRVMTAAEIADAKAAFLSAMVPGDKGSVVADAYAALMAKTFDKLPAFHVAVIAGRRDLVEQLASPSVIDDNGQGAYQTPLFYAVVLANTDMIRLLVSRGVDIERHLGGGLTVRTLAQNRGREDIVSLLDQFSIPKASSPKATPPPLPNRQPDSPTPPPLPRQTEVVGQSTYASVDAGMHSVLNLSGTAHLERGEYDLAVEDFTKAIQLNPAYARAYFNRGSAYNLQGRYSLAIPDFTSAISLDPTYWKAYGNRSVSYSETRQYALALKDCDKLIELDPDNAGGYLNRCIVYCNMRTLDRGRADALKAMELDPEGSYGQQARSVLRQIANL